MKREFPVKEIVQNRRQFLKTAALSTAVTGLVSYSGKAQAQSRKTSKPNLLVIMTDQQRFDTLSCAGNKILDTPNMDRIAREGVWFENTYTQCAVCSPARASMLTGYSTANHGIDAAGRGKKGGASLVRRPCPPYLTDRRVYHDVLFNGSCSGKRSTGILVFIHILYSLVFITIKLGWLRDWLPRTPQFLIMLINPGTILTALYVFWAIFIRRRTGSQRNAALALFTCAMMGLVILTVVGLFQFGYGLDEIWLNSGFSPEGFCRALPAVPAFTRCWIKAAR